MLPRLRAIAEPSRLRVLAILARGEFSLSLNALRLKKADENEDFLKIPTFSIKETELNMTKREMKIGVFATQKGELLIKRLANGDMNILKLVAPSPTAQETASNDQPPVDKGKPPEKPWLVSLRNLSVDNYGIRVEDQTNSEPVHHCKKHEGQGGEYLDR